MAWQGEEVSIGNRLPHGASDDPEESRSPRRGPRQTAVLALTPHTVEFLAGEKLEWHADLTYVDRPHRIKTQSDVIAAVPNGDFTDTASCARAARSRRRLYGTYDYLYHNEPMSMSVPTRIVASADGQSSLRSSIK